MAPKGTRLKAKTADPCAAAGEVDDLNASGFGIVKSEKTDEALEGDEYLVRVPQWSWIAKLAGNKASV